MTVELPRKFQSGRIGITDTRTEPDGVNPWTTRWTGQNRDIPMPLGTGGGYVYRRDKSGWIYAGPSAAGDQQRFLTLGSTFLPQYGEHESDVSVLGHEYDMLFRLGGAKEMPAEQVIALGFGAKAPVVDGEPLWKDSPLEAFPQLAGVQIPPLRSCKYCPRELWDDTQERNHVSVMHADRISAFEQANAIADGMRQAVAVGRATAEVVAPDPVETPAEPEPEPEPQVVEPAPEEPEVEDATMRCGICAEGFNKIPLFLAHVKQCKERRNAQEG